MRRIGRLGRNLRLWTAVLLLSAAAGCVHTYTQADQEQLIEWYDRGELDRAADFAMEMSDTLDQDGATGDNTILWHLEAGSVNLDAGRYQDAMTALERAEQLLYGVSGSGVERFQQVGMGGSYRAYRSEWLALNLLKFFLYFEQGRFEDSLVEIRRIRQAQFDYLLRDSDWESREYDQANAGKNVLPLRLQRALDDGSDAAMLAAAPPLQTRALEFRERRCPGLALLFNPLAFYLSAVGYYWDDDFAEAVIDLRYLQAMQPDNPLFRSDYATVLRLLGDPEPPELAKESGADHALDDQMALVILAEGRAPGWDTESYSVQLPDQVPATWRIASPAASGKGGDAPRLRVEESGKWYEGALLADWGAIQSDEYFRLMLPALLRNGVGQIEATTAAHKAAEATLLALQEQRRRATDWQDQLSLDASIAVAMASWQATSHAAVDHGDWRRWSTLPARYQAVHVPIGTEREFTVCVEDRSGRSLFQQKVQLEKDVNRAVVYIREIGGRYTAKIWSSME